MRPKINNARTLKMIELKAKAKEAAQKHAGENNRLGDIIMVAIPTATEKGVSIEAWPMSRLDDFTEGIYHSDGGQYSICDVALIPNEKPLYIVEKLELEAF